MKASDFAKSMTLATLALAGLHAQAADWSDTSIAISYGTQYKEPYVANGAAISKDIYTLKHIDGDKYGTNFFNVDLLQSNSVDDNAQEAYIVYRRLFDFGKIKAQKYEFGPFRDVGLTAGFDLNTKNDPGYASRKRMFVIGPTLMADVPGFLNISLLLLDESNAPLGSNGQHIARYTYKTHPDLSLVWGMPIGASAWEFEGYADFIASKGTNEYGGPTAPEQHIYATALYDASSLVGASKNSLKVGVGYEYWHNKFGNPSSVPGSFAHTPFLKAEYHF